MPETIQAYLETVQEQIRWKRARPLLAQELEQHLEDQRDDFLKEGKTLEEAERLAVEDMGDPVTVGTELDAVHRPKPQWGLLGLTAVLALVGAVLRAFFFRTTPYSNAAWVLAKALAALGLGTAAMLGMYYLDVSRLARHARAVYIGALALGALSLALSPNTHPSYYTYYVGTLYPVAYVLWLYSFRNRGWLGFILTILGGVPLAAVCCKIPSMPVLFLLLLSGLVLTLCAAWQDWFGAGRWKGLCMVLGIAFSILAYLAFQEYPVSLLVKLQNALHPELDPLGRGWTGTVIQKFLENIPLLQGPLENYATNIGIWGYTMPSDLLDDLLPISIAVRWGWLPFLLLLAALTALLLWLLVKGLRQKYLLGRLVVLAVVITLGIQMLFSTVLNLGFVLFSASLPLVVGNLQTVMDMALIGLALSVFRGNTIIRDEPVLPFRRMRKIRLRIELE